MAGLLRTWSERMRELPVRRIRRPRWAEQEGTWRAAKPPVIAAALKRALSRPSGNWFVLAASREITQARPFGRTVAGIEVVAWRTQDGRVLAGPGACPHMGAPLSQARVHCDQLVCRWHGLKLGESGGLGWSTLPAYDDGVLCWVRLDAVDTGSGDPGGKDTGSGGAEPSLPEPVIPRRPPHEHSIAAVATAIGTCEPEDIVANRLDPWHGSWFHPYSFANLRVTHAPSTAEADDPDTDRFEVQVAFRLAPAFGVPVRATFTCPEPRTVVMHIVEGEGAGSVVETHATPLGNDSAGNPRTAMIEATVAYSDRPGFRGARHVAGAVRPLMRKAALRLWRDDLAYAERRYELRSTGRWPG